LAQRNCGFRGLLAGVRFEGGAVLDDFGHGGKLRQIAQLDAEIAEDFLNLPAFLGIARAEHENRCGHVHLGAE
jgi:hypothetical protein